MVEGGWDARGGEKACVLPTSASTGMAVDAVPIRSWTSDIKDTGDRSMSLDDDLSLTLRVNRRFEVKRHKRCPRRLTPSLCLIAALFG